MTVSSLDLERLKKATDLTDVAKLLGVKPSQLSYALYRLQPNQKYHTFKVRPTFALAE
jgi:RNA-directed DNA polymerase